MALAGTVLRAYQEGIETLQEDLEIVDLLIEYGADKEETVEGEWDGRTYTPIQFALYWTEKYGEKKRNEECENRKKLKQITKRIKQHLKD